MRSDSVIYTGGQADIENGGASCLKDRHRHPKFIPGGLGLGFGFIFGQWVDRLAEGKLALEPVLYLYIRRSFADPHDRKSGRLLRVAMRTSESPIIHPQQVNYAEMLQLTHKEVQELEFESVSVIRSPHLWGTREFDEFVYIQTAHVKL